MPLMLAYKTKNQTYYLTQNNGWTTNQNSDNLLKFKSVKKGRAFYQQYRQNSARSAFANRKLYKLLFVNDKVKQEPIPLEPGSYNHYIHHCGDRQYDPESISELVNILTNPQNNILILDLEFFQNTNNEKEFLPQQISGRLFNSWENFDYHVFDTNLMSTNLQLNFLKHSNLPFKEAKEFSLDKITTKIKTFLKDNDVNYLLSWDNRLDLYTLHQYADPELFNGINSIDLAKLIANTIANDKNGNFISLKNFTKVLNLKHSGKWHNAKDDVEAINQICLNYCNQENYWL